MKKISSVLRLLKNKEPDLDSKEACSGVQSGGERRRHQSPVTLSILSPLTNQSNHHQHHPHLYPHLRHNQVTASNHHSTSASSTSTLRKLGYYCWSWEPSNGLFSTCVTSCSLFYAVANIQYEISKHSTTNPLVLKTKSEENCHKLESLMKVTVMSRGENECDKKDWMKK